MFKNILLVCTGNICRSVLAEYLLKSSIQQHNLDIQVSSAGIGALIGFPADEHVVTLLKEQNIDCSMHQARQINKKIMLLADLILVMEKNHLYNISRVTPESRGKIFLLGHWQKREIADPFRQELPTFRKIMEEINQGMISWAPKIYTTH